mgnify:CR=1 FL=1
MMGNATEARCVVKSYCVFTWMRYFVRSRSRHPFNLKTVTFDLGTRILV